MEMQEGQVPQNDPRTFSTVDTREITYGERAVGLGFNPSENPLVYKVKSLYAEIIDICNLVRENEKTLEKAGGVPSGERMRLFSVAITEAQTAQMWAVKAITYRF
jgi:rRNA processing protein Krr1/Pno1